jgi:hypothetical protein
MNDTNTDVMEIPVMSKKSKVKDKKYLKIIARVLYFT